MSYAHAGEDASNRDAVVSQPRTGCHHNNEKLEAIGHLTDAEVDAGSQRIAGMLLIDLERQESERIPALWDPIYPILGVVVPSHQLAEARTICHAASARGLMRRSFSSEADCRAWVVHWYEMLSLDRTLRRSQSKRT